MIKITHKGNFSKTYNFLDKMIDRNYVKRLDPYARKGVEALAAATPKDTGVTAASWSYEITQEADKVTITWTNSNLAGGKMPVVLLLQYGHATRNGGYVKGIDFINPAMKPIFDQILKDVWREVSES